MNCMFYLVYKNILMIFIRKIGILWGVSLKYGYKSYM